MDSWFTVVIPTRDSAGWIGELLAYYRRHDLTPVILLDGRTIDDTRSIVEAHGCRIVPVDNFAFTEGVVSLTRGCVRTPWALFMHDDEAPSRELLARLGRTPPSADVQSVAISRRWAWHVPGKPLSYGVTDHWSDRTGQSGMDYTWRLFRPDQVRFIDTVHTEGFLIDRWARFPPELYFVHFEWVLRTYAQRVMKLRGYDRYRYGYGRFFERYYLPERFDPGEISYPDFETTDFDALAAAYYRSRKLDILVTAPSFLDRYARFQHTVKTTLFPPRPGAEPKDRTGLKPAAEKENKTGASEDASAQSRDD